MLIPVYFRLILTRAAIEHQLYFINILLPRWAFRQGGLRISDALVKYVHKSRILKTLADTKIKNAFSAQQNHTKWAPNKKYSAANNLLHIFP